MQMQENHFLGMDKAIPMHHMKTLWRRTEEAGRSGPVEGRVKVGEGYG